MAYLYEKIEALREAGFTEEVPVLIKDNINKSFELRPYQSLAFENFIMYYGNSRLCQKPTQVLFHMATGSGKTLIMAGLILYLYKKGYRNFLFFVNLSNIVLKTKENFLNTASSKYLFSDEIVIDCQRVTVREVSNFQDSDPDSINICFTTTQALHYDMQFPKENSMSFDDFEVRKVVLISDEAHHLNADTKRMTADEEESNRSWESTVRRIFEANSENVLLEFTATCDIENANIRAAYENKILVDYPLTKFREDGYSKEIKTLRSDLNVDDRALQALILSQYRYKVFQDNHLNIKPVVFFKSKLVKENAANMQSIIEMVQNLTGTDIEKIYEETTSETVTEAKRYFEKHGISTDMLAVELKDDFSEGHCISANDYQDVQNKQIALNTLEDKSNPYRAVFAVDKLNEGWDVLNLFDIVRLYETRDGKNGIPGKTTIKEAQLIGRGARYCPFIVDAEQAKYQRKYDHDLDNPLRVCEELFYHCWNEPRYISELHKALRELGLDLENTVERTYRLKDSFKADSLYKEGIVFINERTVIDRKTVYGLPQAVRDRLYTMRLATGKGGEDVILADDYGDAPDAAVETFVYHTTFKKIADINYAIVQKALCKYEVFKFNVLKSYFPNLKSTHDFVYYDAYLGNIKIDIVSKYENPSPAILFAACINVLGKIADSVSSIEEVYQGTKIFRPQKISEIFKNKKCNYTNPYDGSVGISQNNSSVRPEWKIDLSLEEWFAFEDNYGTSEEKAFVAHFKGYVKKLEEEYDKVYLVRNERQFHIYSFDDGGRFEPDYVLFLHKKHSDGFEQLQVFIEPKGTHLLVEDAWKERFMLQMKDSAVPVKVFKDDNDYFIWGFHFFNNDKRSKEFSDDMDSLFGVGTLRKTTLEDLPLAADSPMDNPENSVNG
jgi:type III restriction enzyme